MKTTTIEQSLKLIEHGLHINTADHLWAVVEKYITKDGEVKYINYYRLHTAGGDFCCVGEELEWDKEERKRKRGDVPAWSAEALIDLMPDEIWEYCLDIGKWYDTEAQQTSYAISYERKCDGTIISGCDFNAPALLDAAVSMTLWLLDNGHLKQPKK